MTWRAADRHKTQWPDGVTVRAVTAPAPAYNVMTEDMTAYGIRKTPVAVMRGTCDGQVDREAFSFATGDDAGHDGDHPGRCTVPGDSAYETQLTEAGQRQVAAAYIDAFFRRHLTGDERFDAMLTGKRHPLADIASVDVAPTDADSALSPPPAGSSRGGGTPATTTPTPPSTTTPASPAPRSSPTSRAPPARAFSPAQPRAATRLPVTVGRQERG